MASRMVVCDCGSKTFHVFTLNDGGEVIAVCSNCGKQYSGTEFKEIEKIAKNKETGGK